MVEMRKECVKEPSGTNIASWVLRCRARLCADPMSKCAKKSCRDGSSASAELAKYMLSSSQWHVDNFIHLEFILIFGSQWQVLSSQNTCCRATSSFDSFLLYKKSMYYATCSLIIIAPIKKT